jgi:hypothetical protein
MADFAGKNVLGLGASRGIGAAIVRWSPDPPASSKVGSSPLRNAAPDQRREFSGDDFGGRAWNNPVLRV